MLRLFLSLSLLSICVVCLSGALSVSVSLMQHLLLVYLAVLFVVVAV